MSLACILFFLRIRRPPRSTLFPYTRSSDLCGPSSARRSVNAECDATSVSDRERNRADVPLPSFQWTSSAVARSEEHTSELQSHVNLVCRLLLEKKNEHNNAPLYIPLVRVMN